MRGLDVLAADLKGAITPHGRGCEDFTPSEMVAIWNAEPDNKSTFLTDSVSRIDRLSQYVGVSHDTLTKARAVVNSGDDRRKPHAGGDARTLHQVKR